MDRICKAAALLIVLFFAFLTYAKWTGLQEARARQRDHIRKTALLKAQTRIPMALPASLVQANPTPLQYVTHNPDDVGVVMLLRATGAYTLYMAQAGSIQELEAMEVFRTNAHVDPVDVTYDSTNGTVSFGFTLVTGQVALTADPLTSEPKGVEE
jgi:hypothetical protein